jgi:hypothetical protein
MVAIRPKVSFDQLAAPDLEIMVGSSYINSFKMFAIKHFITSQIILKVKNCDRTSNIQNESIRTKL